MSDHAKSFHDWRLETIRTRFRGEKREVTLQIHTVETLFAMDGSVPLSNPSEGIERGLSGYWRILREAAYLFSSHDWQALTAMRSPFDGAAFKYASADELAATIEADYSGDNWCNEVLVVKALLPRIRALSKTEFEAFREILFLLRISFSDEPHFTLGQLLPGLLPEDSSGPKSPQPLGRISEA